MAEPIKFCKYCAFWKDVLRSTGALGFGVCTNIETASKVAIEKNNNVAEKNGEIFTDPCFGCVNWRDAKYFRRVEIRPEL